MRNISEERKKWLTVKLDHVNQADKEVIEIL